jgi:hypothetical protein
MDRSTSRHARHRVGVSVGSRMNRALDPWPPPQEKGRPTRSRRPWKNRSGRKRQGQDSASDAAAQPPIAEYAVNILFFGRPQAWGHYATAAEADAEVAKLIKLNFHAERVAR